MLYCRVQLAAGVLLAAALGFSGCTEKQNARRISTDEFARIYANVVLRSQGVDSLHARAVADSLLRVNGLGAEDVAALVAYYQGDPRRWIAFYEKVERILERETSLQVASPADSSTPQAPQKPQLESHRSRQ